MICKPEVVVELDTGAIAQAHVQLGDEVDHKEMAGKVLEAQQNINRASGEKLDTLTVQSLASDKGYFAVSEMQVLQGEGVRTVIADPIDNRRLEKLEPAQKKAIQAAGAVSKANWVKRFYVVVACTSKEASRTFWIAAG